MGFINLLRRPPHITHHIAIMHKHVLLLLLLHFNMLNCATIFSMLILSWHRCPHFLSAATDLCEGPDNFVLIPNCCQTATDVLSWCRTINDTKRDNILKIVLMCWCQENLPARVGLLLKRLVFYGNPRKDFLFFVSTKKRRREMAPSNGALEVLQWCPP